MVVPQQFASGLRTSISGGSSGGGQGGTSVVFAPNVSAFNPSGMQATLNAMMPQLARMLEQYQNLTPYIRIKDKFHTWKEGEGIIFDDSWEHEVYNRSNDIRVVLIVDFFRPMALPIHAVNWSFYKMLAHFSGESKDVLEKIEKYSPNS
jgi:Aspartyl/Asparaginyl beta-hydroxylase